MAGEHGRTRSSPLFPAGRTASRWRLRARPRRSPADAARRRRHRLLLPPAGDRAHGGLPARARLRRALAARQPRAPVDHRGRPRRHRLVARAVCQHRSGDCQRPDRRGSVRALLQDRLPPGRGHDRHDVGALSRDRGREPRRVLLPDSVRDARHDDHGGRHRSHHQLHRARDDGRVVLHPGRLHQAEPALERGGGQVFPARRVLARHPALRDVDSLRALRHDEFSRDGGGVHRRSARAAARARRDSGRRRHGIQDRGGAVSHVGARRLRGRAHARHGVSLGRFEGRLVRDAAPALRRGAAVDDHATGSSCSRCWPS